MTKELKDWEKELEKNWDKWIYHTRSYISKYTKVKSFIRQLLSSELKLQREEIEKDIHLAKGCLNFKGFYCENKDCLNKGCPLNQKK